MVGLFLSTNIPGRSGQAAGPARGGAGPSLVKCLPARPLQLSRRGDPRARCLYNRAASATDRPTAIRLPYVDHTSCIPSGKCGRYLVKFGGMTGVRGPSGGRRRAETGPALRGGHLGKATRRSRPTNIARRPEPFRLTRCLPFTKENRPQWAGLLQTAFVGVLWPCDLFRQLPQLRTGPQSIWTKLEPEYRPTPPAPQLAAARNIWLTEREESRRSAA